MTESGPDAARPIVSGEEPPNNRSGFMIPEHVGWEEVEDYVLMMDLRTGEVLRLIGAAADGWKAIYAGEPLTAEQREAVDPLIPAELLQPSRRSGAAGPGDSAS